MPGTLTQQQLAEQLEVSRQAVGKAERSGRIRREPNGLFDPARARRAWDANTSQKSPRNRVSGRPKGRPRASPPAAAAPDPHPHVNGNGKIPTLSESQAVREHYKALKEKNSYRKLEKETLEAGPTRLRLMNASRAACSILDAIADRCASLARMAKDDHESHSIIQAEVDRAIDAYRKALQRI